MIKDKAQIKKHIKEQLSYRCKMQVKDYAEYNNGNVFPKCPRCKTPMERDYMHYCDWCGQKLYWKGYENLFKN